MNNTIYFYTILLTLSLLYYLYLLSNKEHFIDNTNTNNISLENIEKAENLLLSIKNKEMTNTLLDNISELLKVEFNNKKIDELLNTNVYNDYDNKNVKETIKTRLDLDTKLIKKKILEDKLKKVKLSSYNKNNLEYLKEKLENIKLYEEYNKETNEYNTNKIHSMCPNGPIEYNYNKNDNYNLDITMFPTNWYGMNGVKLNNKLPHNYIII
jgi:hypothetical protein